MHHYPVWAEVDLDAIGENCEAVRSGIAAGREILLVVKADAYGLGAIAVAHEAARHGVTRLGVATVDEAIELRQSGVDLPILLFSPPLEDELPDIVQAEIEPTIASPAIAAAYDSLCADAGVIGRYQVEIDTGMGRWGVWPADAPGFFASVRDLAHIEPTGVYMHFPATADEQQSFSREQVRVFDETVDRLRALGIALPNVHSANSANICWGIGSRHDTAVRPGILIYGFLPPESLPADLAIRPAFAIRSRVVQVRPFGGGENVSYGLTHQVAKPTNIASIPVGYGHGFSRALSGTGDVLIRGKRYPIVGQITMDALMVDVGLESAVEPGDEVVLVGAMGSEKITVDELARKAGRIPYEITCAIGRRVPRVYTRSRREVWTRTMLGSRRLDGEGEE